jgi:hypothetical protein
MNDDERNTMREHIVWLTQELETTRKQLKIRDDLLAELLDPDQLGHAVTNEVRGRIYTLLHLQENNV